MSHAEIKNVSKLVFVVVSLFYNRIHTYTHITCRGYSDIQAVSSDIHAWSTDRSMYGTSWRYTSV